MVGCWPWPTIAAARQRWPHRLPTLLEAGTLPELEPLQAHLGPDPQSLPQLATLECELLDRRRFRSRDEARLGVFEFIEGSTIDTGGIRRWLPVAGRVRGRSGQEK